ncbi:Hypothetical protein, putative [Bodo saltans]|uniref:Calcineurin-like phosphoesterase domain-containing protein n=1 Tax=Bodo saltans TaxID=75058 RepID=A0A0S4ISN6_BODSA|nr:Hypothetical protein, putative [Bodo saltans]|eukprot:CUF66122.1 Hypothetical protein, putative [Bodo saltans]
MQKVAELFTSVTDAGREAVLSFRRGSNVTDSVMYLPGLDCGDVAPAVVPIDALPPLLDDAFRVVCVSDTHDGHRQFRLPAADLLLFGGDIQMTSRNFSASACEKKVRDFNAWLGENTQVSQKIVIGGNHDAYLESLGRRASKELLSHASYLVFEELAVVHPRHPDRIRPLWVYGAPFSLGRSGNAAYQLRKNAEADWGSTRRIPPTRIPAVVRGLLERERREREPGFRLPRVPLYDIALTHHPRMSHFEIGTDASKSVKMVSGHVHVGGHIHAMYGVAMWNHVPCVVACSLTNKYEANNPPIVFDYRPSDRKCVAMEPRVSAAVELPVEE